jgi:C4-dicarboxylate transporter DctM subunit
MVVLGAIANISIAGLFMGGFLPGFLMALSLMVVLYVQSVRGILPRAQSARPPFRVVLVSLRDSLVPLLMPVIIFGGIFGGVFTATEAAAVSTVYAFLVSCFIYKELTIRALYRVLVDTAVLTGMTCLLVGAATTFSWILATHQVPRLIGSGIEAIGGGPRIFLLLAVTVFLVFGLVLDGLPAILIFFPILYPIATALQIHPLHFGILVIAAVEIAIVAPPLGLCLVIICSIAKVQLADTIRPSIPYISILIVDLIIMVFWPQLVLILPQLFKL